MTALFYAVHNFKMENGWENKETVNSFMYNGIWHIVVCVILIYYDLLQNLLWVMWNFHFMCLTFLVHLSFHFTHFYLISNTWLFLLTFYFPFQHHTLASTKCIHTHAHTHSSTFSRFFYFIKRQKIKCIKWIFNVYIKSMIVYGK